MDDHDRDELHEGMRIVGSALSAAQIPFALAGGFAAWVHGAPESDHDADFVVREHDVEKARAVLEETEGLRVEDPVENWLFKAYHGGALVDLIFRLGGAAVTEEMLERTDSFDVFGVPMPVLRATDVVAEKMRVLTEQRCNFSDLLPVVRALREQVDWGEVADRVVGNPYAEAFLFLLERLAVAPGGTVDPLRGTDGAGGSAAVPARPDAGSAEDAPVHRGGVSAAAATPASR